MNECMNLDAAANLTKPCYVAKADTIHHWCDPCVRTEIGSLRAGVRDLADALLLAYHDGPQPHPTLVEYAGLILRCGDES